jgi:hypothetical protein
METPDGAWGMTTVSQAQNVTQEGVAGAATADMQNLLDEVRNTFIDNLLGGFANVGSHIVAAINQFISDLVMGLKNVTGGLVDLTGILHTTQVTAEEAQVTTQEQGIIITGQASRIEEVQLDVPNYKQYSESMNLTEDCTFDRVHLNTVTVTGSGSGTGGDSDFDTATDSDTSGDVSVSVSVTVNVSVSVTVPVTVTATKTPFITTTLGKLEGGYIRAPRTRTYSALTFIVDAVASNPAQLYVCMGRMLSNGNLLIEYVSPDLTTGLDNSRQEVTHNMPGDTVIPVDGGETMFAGVVQIGAGKNTRPLAGITMLNVPLSSGLYPPKQGFTAATFTVAPTLGGLITVASTNFAADNIPWLGLGTRITGLVKPKRSYYDSFDRADNSTLGPNWMGVHPEIDANAVEFRGTSAGNQEVLYLYPMAYDDHQVTGARSSAVLFGSQTQGLFIRSNSDRSNCVILAWSNSAIELQRRVNGSYTSLGSYSRSNSVNDVFWVTAIGDTFRVYVNGTNIITYTGALSKGPQQRYVGLYVSRSGITNSGGFLSWSARDL